MAGDQSDNRLPTQGAQFGFINIDLGAAGELISRRKLLDRVGSYGRQLGRIGDALEVILKHVKLGDLKSEEQDALDILKGQFVAVAGSRRSGAQARRRHVSGQTSFATAMIQGVRCALN